MASESLAQIVDYPLYVVTVAAGDELSGCLAGFVSQCSIHPPQWLVCISRRNHTYGVATRAGGLALHLLGAGQADTAALFGEETGDAVDKLVSCRWRPGPGGAPVLERCAAWVAGPIEGRAPFGDHEGFVLAAADGGVGDEEGQLTFRHIPPLAPGHPA